MAATRAMPMAKEEKAIPTTASIMTPIKMTGGCCSISDTLGRLFPCEPTSPPELAIGIVDPLVGKDSCCCSPAEFCKVGSPENAGLFGRVSLFKGYGLGPRLYTCTAPYDNNITKI